MKVSGKKAKELRRVIHNALYETRLNILPLFLADSVTHGKVDLVIAQSECLLFDKVVEVLERKYP